MKRSTFLQNAAAIAAGSIISSCTEAESSKLKSFRFAHITDIHVMPNITAETGMARALHHVQSKSKIDFIINGGDSIMDSLEADKQRTQMQWDVFHKILRNENSLPIHHCIGNHDIWGWFLKSPPAGQPGNPTNDRLYGKNWVVETLNMGSRYYSFKKGKWHFIILDSTQLNPAGGYIARLDEEQLTWLQQELSLVPADKFICIVSHIPLLSISAGLFFNKTETNGDLKIQRNLMHTDFLALKKIFRQYPNIKVCISGHIHLQDELDYLGIKYYCNGAVSGNWWKGAFQEFEPAYAIIELFQDGTSQRTMVNYNS